MENPGSKTFLCIASHQSLRVKNLIKKGDHDIATADWLTRTLGSDKSLATFPRFNRKDMHHMTASTMEEIRNHFDRFDDSYTEPFASPNELLGFFETMDSDVRF